MKNILAVGLSLSALMVSAPVVAQDGPVFEVYGGAGLAVLHGNEYVYATPGSTDRLSVLYWDSTAPVLTKGFSVTLPSNWVFGADVQIGAGGDSFMVDYDWLPAFRTSFDFDQWTDRSQHPDTALLWYFNGSMYAGYDVVHSETATVTINTGVRYIDVKWDARGGTAVRSDNGFRAATLTFPDGESVISYRQQIPSVFVGLDGEIERGRWLFEGGVKVGVTFNAMDNDIHFPSIDFRDAGKPAAILSATGRTSFAVTDMLSLFVAGSVDHMMDTRADTSTFAYPSGEPTGTNPDGAGFGFSAYSITGGIAGHF